VTTKSKKRLANTFENRIKKAKGAIEDLFCDDNVTKEETRKALRELRNEIDACLDAL